MDFTVIRDIDTDINQIISRILADAFERIGPAGQATTGTDTTAGRVAVPGLKANGVVLVTAAESPGDGVAIGHVAASAGYFTVYDDTETAPIAIAGKKVNYFVLDLGTE